MLNVQKATLDKMQKNAEIVTIAQALGLEINEKTMKLKYEEDKLRYGKIIIASDADVDGAHIKNLFYTFIWNFCPELIIDGYVYGLVPPLYRIIMDKKTIYLKGDKELDEFKKEHPGKKYTVNRLKGLGEMSEDETTILVDPEQRIIKQITVEDIKGADKVFEDLMGAATTPKKEFIKKNSHKAVNFI